MNLLGFSLVLEIMFGYICSQMYLILYGFISVTQFFLFRYQLKFVEIDI